jgi:hypothetical protein
MKAALKNDRGIALIVTIMVMALLLSITGSGLLFSAINLKTTSSFKRGSNALYVADAGIRHALAVISAGTTFDYSTSTEVASGSLGTNYTYTVTAVNDSTSSGGNTRAILTSTAVDANGTKRVVEAYVDRSTKYGFGATSMPGSDAATTETNFSGDAFSINGNDYCGAAPAVPGISVTDPDLATEITNDSTSDGGLDSGQMDNVIGDGGTPSVKSMAGLDMTVSEIADAFLANSHVDLDGGIYSSGTWGTSDAPVVTQINGDAQIQGTVEGYGVLIIDGALDVAGNFTFHGLVIARGDIEVQFSGNAGIYGSLMIDESITQDAGYEFDVRGNANIQYDSCALAAADSWVTLPKAAKLIAWQEKFS